MKGLLIKDFKLVFVNARTLMALVVISIFLLFSSDTGEQYSFVISYMTVISFLFVLSSVSYDDFDHGLSFLMTLPVSRKIYVLEKYLFGLLCGIGGWTFSMLICLVASFVGKADTAALLSPEFMLTSITIYIVLSFILSITLPVQLKFGGDNGKIFIILAVGALFVIGFAASKIAANFGVDLKEWLNRLLTLEETFLTLALGALALIALAVSYLISYKIMKNKQL